jgi:hypothetical protein
MEQLGQMQGFVDRRRKLLRPRFTVVLHQVREELDLSMSSYAVLDSIHTLSHSNHDYVWCTMSKEEIGKFLGLSRRTIFNAVTEGLTKGLLEKNDRGDLRTTLKWVDTVSVYSPQKDRDAR